MSGFRGIVAATAAGAAAYVIFKAARVEGSQAKVVYVSQPERSGIGKAAGFLQAALGIIDAATGKPVFEDAVGKLGQVGTLADQLATGEGWPGGFTPGGTGTGQRLLSDLMRDFGLARHQAAGVVGSLHFESGGFTTLQEISPLVAGSRGGYGYAQWTGPRRRDFEAWAAAHGLSLQSYEANYGFLRHELANTSEGRVIPMLKRAATATEATIIFTNTFLRPGIVHMDKRLAATAKYA